MKKQAARVERGGAWTKSLSELSFSEETQLLMNIHELRQLASCLFAFLNELETPESIMSDTQGESTHSKEPVNLNTFRQRNAAKSCYVHC